MSIETREKISIATRGRPKGPMPVETRAKIGQSLIGKPWDTERKQRYTSPMFGKTHTAESRAKIKAARALQVMTPMSEDTREKLRVAKIGWNPSVETRKKIGDAHRGKAAWNKGIACPDDVKEKLRQANLGKKASFETREKLSLFFRNVPRTPEWCQRIAEGKRRHIVAGTDCAGACCRPKWSNTLLEQALARLLGDFPHVVQWKRFGHFTVDAYLPHPYHLAFEADGWHHQFRIERDLERDQWLLKNHQLIVIRLTTDDLKGI